MPSDTVTYQGFVETRSWGTPLLASGGTPEAREKAKRESSGGVIFPTRDEMPKLLELIESGEMRSAVLFEADAPSVDEAVMTAGTDWRDEAERRLSFNLDIADRDEVMDEPYAFLAAMVDDAVDAFLARAHRLLEDDDQTEAAWAAFLDAEGSRTFESFGHDAIPLEKDIAKIANAEEEWKPLITAEAVGVSFRRGALGGPRPLADVAEV